MTANGTKGVGSLDYRTLRFVVGVLGFALPLVLMFWGFFLMGGFELQPSISDYYSLRTRDALVGILFTIAWFFYAYSPYEGQDNKAGNCACVFALGVALFPSKGTAWDPFVHFGCAFGLFLTLFYFSFCLFTRSGATKTPRKRIRNAIYRTCGVVILVCVALIGLYFWRWQDSAFAKLKPVFWLEAIALWAFGVSWFVKGEPWEILRDAAPSGSANPGGAYGGSGLGT